MSQHAPTKNNAKSVERGMVMEEKGKRMKIGWVAFVLLNLGFLAFVVDSAMSRIVDLDYSAPIVILVLVASIVIYVLCTYYTFVRYRRPAPIMCDGFKSFCSLLYYNRPDKFKCISYKPPSNKKVFFAVVGVAVAWAGLFISNALSFAGMASSNWSQQQWYFEYFARRFSFVGLFNFSIFGLMVVVVSAIIALVSVYIWLALAYLSNLKLLRGQSRDE